jgi:YbbR domain-containing protein
MKGFVLRLFSLLVAVALWYFVNSESNLTLVSFLAPIELQDLANNRIVTFQSHRQAQVTVKGPAFLISKLSSNPPLFRIPAPKDGDSRMVVPLLKSQLDLPQTVQIVSIEPAEIKFNFDQLVKKKVPVVVPRIGALGDSYIVRDVEIAPSEVTISGPESDLQAITSVETYPLDLRTVSEDFTRSINLRLPGNHIESDQDKVNIKIDIDLVVLDRVFTQIPLEIRSLESLQKLKTVPSIVDVLVSGPREQVKGLLVSDIQAFVSASDFSEGKSFPIDIDLPKGIKLISTTPKVVKVFRITAAAVANKKK